MIILAAVPFGSKRFMVNVFDRYKTLYSIIIGISILVWLLLFFGIPVPGKIIAPLNAVKHIIILHIHFSYSQLFRGRS